MSTGGSWEAGVDSAKPGIIMKGNPQVGDAYRQEYYEDEAVKMEETFLDDKRNGDCFVNYPGGARMMSGKTIHRNSPKSINPRNGMAPHQMSRVVTPSGATPLRKNSE